MYGVRVGIGVVEAIALGWVHWTAVYVISSLAGMPILITQVGLYLLLLIAGGLVYFAAAVLVSSLVSGEYTAPFVAFGAILLPTILSDVYLPLFLKQSAVGDWRLLGRHNHLSSLGTFTAVGNTGKFVFRRRVAVGFDRGRAKARVLKAFLRREDGSVDRLGG